MSGKTVFILGAGASAEGGAPVMASFLDVARNLYFARKVDDRHTAPFGTVFRAIAALNDVYAKAEVDTDNLEAVFAAFEMANLFGRLKGFDPDALKNLPNALRDLIVATLEQTLTLRITKRSGHGYTLDAPRPYTEFTALLPSHEVVCTDVTILTFNYDVALDYALFRRQLSIDYGLAPQRRPNSVPLLKLHGSINWTACPSATCTNCIGKVCVLPVEAIVQRMSPHDVPAVVRMAISFQSQIFHVEQHPSDRESDGAPLLVPPTWSKSEHHHRLVQVWRHAAEQLSTARNIIVIGYSLPETDQFFRYLYALGTISDTRLERFWVINPDSSGAVEQRFRTLLGSTARARFRYFGLTFASALGTSDVQDFLKGLDR